MKMSEEKRKMETFLGREKIRDSLFVLIIFQFVMSIDCNTIEAMKISSRRWQASELRDNGETTTRHKQSIIPAANPNFEAAFQGECGNKNNNGNPCEHICLDLHDGTYECSCFYGFTLAVDGYSCALVSVAAPSSAPAAPSGPGADMAGGTRTNFNQASSSSQTLIPGQLERASVETTSNVLRPATDNPKLVNGSAEGKRPSSGANETPSRRQIRQRSRFSSSSSSSSSFASQLPLSRNLAEANSSNLSTNNQLEADLAGGRTHLSSGGGGDAGDGSSSGASISSASSITTNNKDATKWPSYDVETRQDGAEQESDNFIELSLSAYGEDEDMDPDIRSIMLSNDKLVSQLLNRMAFTSNAPAAHDAAATDNSSNLNWAKENADEKEKDNEKEKEKEDYDLDLLAVLVGKTIEDYNRSFGLEDGIETSFHAKSDEAFSAPPSVNQSSSSIRPRRSSIRQLLTSRTKKSEVEISESSVTESEQDIRCDGEFMDFYRTCNEMPECEAGGRCVVDAQWNGQSNNNDAEKRARCQCPIGRGGQLCQKPMQRIVPKFTGHSYLALPMILDDYLTSLRLLFKPTLDAALEELESLILYNNKFVMLLDELGRVELRYSTSNSYEAVTRVIGSRDVALNKWNELVVTDASIDGGQLVVSDDSINRIVLVTPEKIKLNTNNESYSELFVAGVPDAAKSNQGSKKNVLQDVKLIRGFIGCIREFSINERAYNFRSDLNGDLLDGFDIAECCR